MVLTRQKPTRTNRLPMALLLEADGEGRESLPGSTLEHGVREEKAPERLVKGVGPIDSCSVRGRENDATKLRQTASESYERGNPETR